MITKMIPFLHATFHQIKMLTLSLSWVEEGLLPLYFKIGVGYEISKCDHVHTQSLGGGGVCEFGQVDSMLSCCFPSKKA